MSLFIIHLANALWLILVIVGVPNITGFQLGSLNLSATPEFQMLTLGGLALGAVANLVGGKFLGNKQRRACWKWAGILAALLLLHYLLFQRHLHFQWLKDALLWLKRTVT